jgi:phosphoglycerate dehydrogenase-like enzyme
MDAFPPKDRLAICFAHVAYRLQERFAALDTGIASFAVRDAETLANRIGEADVLVISGLWHNGLLDRAKKLRFIQAIGAGTTSSRATSWRSAASGSPVRAVSTPARLPSTRWP